MVTSVKMNMPTPVKSLRIKRIIDLVIECIYPAADVRANLVIISGLKRNISMLAGRV